MKKKIAINDESLFDFLISEIEKPFSGWDFSYIIDTGRMAESPLKWSYTSKILMTIRNVESLLDMGTGGGEYLSLLQPLPENTYATEGYEPNIPIARKRLELIGVKVIEVGSDNKLSFENDYFDLVINKHEEYSAEEVYRVLKPNCQFITQQVGGLNDLELNKLLGANEDFGMKYWNLEYAVEELKKLGMEIIEQKEDFPITRFYDVGAIVYYLKVIPWQIPDFSIEKYFNSLKNLHHMIQNEGYIDVKEHRFFVVAKKR